MKNGYFYFLNLHYVVFAVRILFIPLIVFTFRLPWWSTYLPGALIVTGLCLVLFFTTLFLPMPTDRKMTSFLAAFEHDFTEKVSNETHTRPGEKLRFQRTFRCGEKAELAHTLGGELLFGHLLMLAAVRRQDGLHLIGADRSLLTAAPTDYFDLPVPETGVTAEISVFEEEFHVAKVILTFGSERLTFLSKSDWRLREFLIMLGVEAPANVFF